MMTLSFFRKRAEHGCLKSLEQIACTSSNNMAAAAVVNCWENLRSVGPQRRLCVTDPASSTAAGGTNCTLVHCPCCPNVICHA